MIREAIASVVLAAGSVGGQLAAQAPEGRLSKSEPTGRYRVTIVGFAAAKGTNDDPRDYDGVKDEVYPAAAAVLWDRKSGAVRSHGFIRSREYGDVGNAGQRGTRIQAGSATAAGGIRANDVVPKEYDPRGNTLPAPSTEQLPLLVWEGELTDSIDGLLVVPSLWESDLRGRAFENYSNTWGNPTAAWLTSPLIQSQLRTRAIGPVTVPRSATVVVANSLTTIFTGSVAGGFAFVSALATANLDRPIGLSPAGNATSYQDRLIVITREKLHGLEPGAGLTVTIPLAEPADGVLDGSYTLFLRVERTQ